MLRGPNRLVHQVEDRIDEVVVLTTGRISSWAGAVVLSSPTTPICLGHTESVRLSDFIVIDVVDDDVLIVLIPG